MATTPAKKRGALGRELFDSVSKVKKPKITAAERTAGWKALGSDATKQYERAAERARTYDEQIRALRIELDAVECSICLEAIAPPIMMCISSHLLCAQCCKKAQRKCPQCRGQVNLRNYALEKLVEKLVVNCTMRGCKASFLGATSGQSCFLAVQHEETCKFRPLDRCPCFWNPCCLLDPIDDLALHLSQKHAFDDEHAFDDAGLQTEFTMDNSNGKWDKGLSWDGIITHRQQPAQKVAYAIVYDPHKSDTHLHMTIFSLSPSAQTTFGHVSLKITSPDRQGPGAAMAKFVLPEVPYAGANLRETASWFPRKLFGPNPEEGSPQQVSIHVKIEFNQ